MANNSFVRSFAMAIGATPVEAFTIGPDAKLDFEATLAGMLTLPEWPMGHPWKASLYAPARCPRCKGTMVRRVAKRGNRAGHAFLGCKRWPACNGTRNL